MPYVDAERAADMFTELEYPGCCIMCSSDRTSRMPGLAHLRRCVRCGHLQLDPRPTQDAIARSYNRESSTHRRWHRQEEGRTVMWKKRARRTGAYFNGPGRALDVGTGFGDYLVELRRGGWAVEGTEVAKDAADRAAERGVGVRLGQFVEMNWESEYFDLVTLWHVLEHVPWPGRALDACARILRPEGILVVAVPNDSIFPRLLSYAMLGRRSAIAALWGVRRPGEEIHLSFFSSGRLVHALRSREFRPIEVGVDDHYPEPSAATNRSIAMYRGLQRLAGINLHRTIYVAARKT